MTCSSEKAAKAAAKDLLGAMRGNGWKTRVWENMGWHYEVRLSVKSGTLMVWPCGDGTYMALLGAGVCHDAGGNYCWSQRLGSHNNPNAAAKEAVAHARKTARTCFDAVEECVKRLGLEKGR